MTAPPDALPARLYAHADAVRATAAHALHAATGTRWRSTAADAMRERAGDVAADLVTAANLVEGAADAVARTRAVAAERVAQLQALAVAAQHAAEDAAERAAHQAQAVGAAATDAAVNAATGAGAAAVTTARDQAAAAQQAAHAAEAVLRGAR